MRLKYILLVVQSLMGTYHTAPIEDESSAGAYENKTEDNFGRPCTSNLTCGDTNLICNENTKLCGCTAENPVYVHSNSECVKSRLIGESCIFDESCKHNELFSFCFHQVCRCDGRLGFRILGDGSIICTNQEVHVPHKISTPHVLSGLLCLGGLAAGTSYGIFLTLREEKAKRRTTSRPKARVYSATEIVQVARTLEASNKSSTRRPSRGVQVSPSRAAAARTAAIVLVSCHIPPRDSSRSLGGSTIIDNSNQNSPRSFSARQFKRENDAKMAKIHKFGHQSSRSSLEQSSSHSNNDSTSRLSEYLSATSSNVNQTEAEDDKCQKHTSIDV